MWFCGSSRSSLGGPWWAGDEQETTPCKSGKSATFTIWPSANVGKVIKPGGSSSSVLSTAGSSSPLARSTHSVSTTNMDPSTGSSILETSVATRSGTTNTENNDNKLPTALGAGLGIPLGIAAVGFLVFLFWRVRRQQTTIGQSRHRISRQQLEMRDHTDVRNRELDGMEIRREMPASNSTLYHEADSSTLSKLGSK